VSTATVAETSGVGHSGKTDEASLVLAETPLFYYYRIVFETINNKKNDSFPKITFTFNKEWEIQNWYDTCSKEVKAGLRNGSKKWGLGDIPSEIPEIIASSQNREDALNKIRPLFEEFINKPESKQIISHSTERAQKNWQEISRKYFQLLSQMLEVPISEFEKEYRAYFTFSQRCPFGDHEFMFKRKTDISNTAAHEIMHIELLKKYNNYFKEKGLSDEQIYHLKEILTVLLNEDMKDIMFKPDSGYFNHQGLRAEVLEIYQQHKKSGDSFQKFLDEIIPVIKNHNFS